MSNKFCLLAFLASVTLVFGAVRPANGQLNPFGQAVDPEKAQKEKFETMLQVRIDEMKRICDLSDKQVGRLQTGAKGTVARSRGRWCFGKSRHAYFRTK